MRVHRLRKIHRTSTGLWRPVGRLAGRIAKGAQEPDACMGQDASINARARPRPSPCAHRSDHMKIVTVRDFRDHATEMFRSDDVILVTRDGTPAGFFLPWDTPELPVEVRREVFLRLSEQV